MNSLEKSLKNYLETLGDNNNYNIDLLNNFFSDSEKYYGSFLDKNKSLPVSYNMEAFKILSKFSHNEDFASVIKKLDSIYYAIHWTGNKKKILVFENTFLGRNVFCVFHFVNNKLAFAKIQLEKDFKTLKKLNSTILNQNVLFNEDSCKFILQDKNNNKLLVNINGRATLTYYNEIALIINDNK